MAFDKISHKNRVLNFHEKQTAIATIFALNLKHLQSREVNPRVKNSWLELLTSIQTKENSVYKINRRIARF